MPNLPSPTDARLVDKCVCDDGSEAATDRTPNVDVTIREESVLERYKFVDSDCIPSYQCS